jgi:hypothetical protein
LFFTDSTGTNVMDIQILIFWYQMEKIFNFLAKLINGIMIYLKSITDRSDGIVDWDGFYICCKPKDI